MTTPDPAAEQARDELFGPAWTRLHYRGLNAANQRIQDARNDWLAWRHRRTTTLISAWIAAALASLAVLSGRWPICLAAVAVATWAGWRWTQRSLDKATGNRLQDALADAIADRQRMLGIGEQA